MKLGTRTQIIKYDKRVRELEERRAKLTWNVWHGRKEDRELLDQVTQEMAELPYKLNYFRTLLFAASEGAGDFERREIEIRFNEAMYNAVRMNPNVLEALKRASDDCNSFRYEFAGVRMTEAEMVRTYQGERDPMLALAMHITALEQSAELKETVLRVVRTMNNEARAAGKLLGVNIESFAELLMERNEISFRHAKARWQELLAATDNMREFIENVRVATGEKNVTPLNQIRVVDGFIEGSGFYEIFPAAIALEFAKEILVNSGYTDFIDVDSLGQPPYLIDLEGGQDTEGEAVTLSFGRGSREYAMIISPFRAKSARDYIALLLHEVGHLAHYEGMEQGNKLHDYFKTDVESFREAMAITMEAMLSDPTVVSFMAEQHPEEMRQMYMMFSRFLDNSQMRRFMTGALFETELYTRPESELDGAYLDIYKKNSLVTLLPEVEDRVIGASWAADSIYALMPGSRIEYGLAYGIASAVLSSLMTAGDGTAIHESTAKLMLEHCYTGPELPWGLRVNRMMQATGAKEKELLH